MSLVHLGPIRPAFHVVVQAVVPAADSLDDEEWDRLDAVVDGALADRPEGVRRQLRLFVRILSLLSFLRWGRPLARLGPARARRLLGTLEGSPALLLRRGVWGLRTLAFMGYYGRAGAREAVGYDARLRGWEERGSDAGPWPGRDGRGAPEPGIVTAEDGRAPGNGTADARG